MAAAFLCLPATLNTQTVASVGVGASVIEYDGFLPSSAAAITPALQFDSRNFSFGAQGDWTIFESGNQVVQFTGAAGWLAALHRRWRIEVAGSAGVSKYAEASAVGHLLGRGRLHFVADNYGAWVGGNAGAAFDTLTTSPLELTLGAWTVQRRVTLMAMFTTVLVENNRYLDFGAAAHVQGKRVEWEARFGARPWTDSRGAVGDALTGVWGEASALVPLTRQISLAISGGSYPSDPVRRVLGATYFEAGFRIATGGTEQLPVLIDPAPVLAAARARINAVNSSNSQIEIIESGALHTIRIRTAAAKSVEIMADFTDWQPTSLINAGHDVWELQLKLTPGVHRLNVRIDGGDWMVPAGARQEQDEFGGVVGIIVVH